jgi:hypothetical protein
LRKERGTRECERCFLMSGRGGGRGRPVDDDSISQIGPFVAFHVRQAADECKAKDGRTHAHPLSFVVFWFCGPREKCGGVFRHLRSCGWRPIFIVNNTIIQILSHGNCAAGKVLVKVQISTHRNTGRRIRVASDQGKYIVLAIMSRFRNERQIGRKGASVGKSCSFIIGIWTGQIISELVRKNKCTRK